MKNILYTTIFMLMLVCTISAQTDTVFYNANSDTVKSLRLATTYEIISRSGAAPSEELKEKYTKAGQKIAEDHYYINGKKKERIGQSRRWYDDGKIKSLIAYSDDKMNGGCKTYWENGQLKRNDAYEDGKFRTGNCYTAKGADTIHYDYEITPEFKGGASEMMKYLQKNIKISEKSKEDYVHGKTYIKFTINEDGSISDVSILKGSGEKEFDNEVIRVVKEMPKWNPGKQDGIPVKVHFMIPIFIRL